MFLSPEITNISILRACITSIIRTYYTWKVVKSSDFSYNIIVMGIWTYAELTIGIIVSCLPVLPRFFNHIGPKIYEILVFGSWSKILLRHRLRSTDNSDETNPTSRIRQPFPERSGEASTPETWKNYRHSKSELRAEYITLDEYETQQSKSAAMNGLTPPLIDDLTTKREDLEYRNENV